jgi:hypothetical protein
MNSKPFRADQLCTLVHPVAAAIYAMLILVVASVRGSCAQDDFHVPLIPSSRDNILHRFDRKIVPANDRIAISVSLKENEVVLFAFSTDDLREVSFGVISSRGTWYPNVTTWGVVGPLIAMHADTYVFEFVNPTKHPVTLRFPKKPGTRGRNLTTPATCED